MTATPISEIENRNKELKTVQALLEIDASIIIQRADLFYFSGTGQDAHLFVPTENDPSLLVRRSLERALEDSPIQQIHPMNSLSDLKNHVNNHVKGGPKRLGMELDILPVNNYRVYCGLFPDTEIVDVSPYIRGIRAVKSDYELDLVKKAAAMNDAMFAEIGGWLKEGMREIDLAAMIELYLRKRDHQGLVRVRGFNQDIFYGHIMSGYNLARPSCSIGPTGGPGMSASFPQGVGTKVINKNEPIQVDYVSVFDSYMVDQARTFYLGEAPEKLLRVHEIALSIQGLVADLGREGAGAESIYQAALEKVVSEGCEKGFMGHPQPVPFVGHGVGLELDEFPIIGRKSPHILKSGMVIALEPKFIFPGEGLAGIENTFVVTENGMKKLTLFDDAAQIIGN